MGPGSLTAKNYAFTQFVDGVLTVVAPGDNKVSIVSSDPAPTYGESLTFNLTVAPDASGAATPTGTMLFEIDGSQIGLPVPLAGGSVITPRIAPLPAGPHRVTAIYSGDGVYNGNIGTLNFVVAKRI